MTSQPERTCVHFFALLRRRQFFQVIYFCFLFSVFCSGRGVDKIAVPSLHDLRTKDLPGQGRRAVRQQVLGIRDGAGLPDVGLRPRKETGGHPSRLHGTLPQRTDLPVQVTSHNSPRSPIHQTNESFISFIFFIQIRSVHTTR